MTTYDPTPCAVCDQLNAGGGKGSGFFYGHGCSNTGQSAAIVTAVNKGQVPVVATVSGKSVTVPAGGKHTFTVPNPNGMGPMTVTVNMTTTAGKTIIATKVVKVDCPCNVTTTTVPVTTTAPVTTQPVTTTAPSTTVVLAPPVSYAQTTTTVGVRTSSPVTLPHVGADTAPVAGLGLGLVALGVVAALLARGRRGTVDSTEV